MVDKTYSLGSVCALCQTSASPSVKGTDGDRCHLNSQVWYKNKSLTCEQENRFADFALICGATLWLSTRTAPRAGRGSVIAAHIQM